MHSYHSEVYIGIIEMSEKYYDPEIIGFNYINAKKALPKLRNVYTWLVDPGRYPYVISNCKVVRDDRGVFVYPYLPFAKAFGMDKEAFAMKFRKNMVSARSLFNTEADPVNVNAKAVFFDTETIQAVSLFMEMRNGIEHNPKILRIAKIILS